MYTYHMKVKAPGSKKYLCRLHVTSFDDDNYTYYCCVTAVFKSRLEPLMAL